MNNQGKPRRLLVLLLILLIITTCIPVTASADNGGNHLFRIAGLSRYETAYAVAKNVRIAQNAVGGVENVVIASGKDFPDALGGGYLTATKKAPLYLYDKTQADYLIKIIKRDMKKDGTVYLLGGAGVIDRAFETKLKQNNLKVSRLAGATRYDTNLAILKRVFNQKNGDELLVASATNFADSLSGSAVTKPMLLVGTSLSAEQKTWLATSNIKKIYILGGGKAVNGTVESELKKYGTVERIAGKTRYETSYKIANKFFPESSNLVIATGTNFPDGLSGAPLAVTKSAPIIIVSPTEYDFARQYGIEKKVVNTYALGGTGVINERIAALVSRTPGPKYNGQLTFIGYFIDPTSKDVKAGKGKYGVILRNDTNEVINGNLKMELHNCLDKVFFATDADWMMNQWIHPGETFVFTHMNGNTGTYGTAFRFGFSQYPSPVLECYSLDYTTSRCFKITGVKPSVDVNKAQTNVPNN